MIRYLLAVILLAYSLSAQTSTSTQTQSAGGAGTGGGVSSINTVTGAFTFSGSGVSCTLTTCTFNGGSQTFPTTPGIVTCTGTPCTAYGTSLTAPTGTIVGTSDTQALTNKDLTGAGNTFPTLNQNTTGSAAKWTTPRALAGNNVDGSAAVNFTNKVIEQGTTDAGFTNAQFLGALATGIVKNTTTTGVLSIAVGSDLPAAIPIGSVGSAGLSGTSPVTINAAGAIGCSTCNVTAAVANPPLDKSGTGLSNPTADATFTYPVGSTTGWTFAGTTPASVASATGTTATTLFQVNGVAGGPCTAAACTGGVGSAPAVNAGVGGSVAGSSGNAVGGAGGNVTVNGGSGASSLNSGANSNGGSIILNPGAPGTGGAGTAGKAGVVSVTGPGAGFIGYQQGTAITTANSQIPANTIIEQAPTSVTAYTLTKPGAAPANNNDMKTLTTGGTESFVQAPFKTMLTSAYTNTTTGATAILSLAVDASTSYVITCRGLWKAATAGEWSFGITGPASPTLVSYHFRKCNTFAAAACTNLDYVGTANTYPSAIGATVVGTVATDMPWEVDIGFTNGTTAGTLALTGLTVSTDTLTVEAGSFCVAQ